MMTAALAVPSRIAERFSLEALAGAGGMGSVYRALDGATGQTVAVKLLHATGEAEIERFTREAQLLSEMRHPGIVTYVAHGRTEAGQPFLAMEWLEGEDLAKRLERGTLALPDALTLLRRAAEALGVAHRRGVVHRDLKPGNLFLRGCEVERVTVVDFGIARRAAASRVMTGTGIVIGTPAYMAPEQASGHRQVNAAADVFALGCVLFECLTGQTPFVADHLMAMLARIIFDEPTPLRALRPDLPESIEALLAQLLAKAPEDRPADAAALLDALDALPERRPGAAPRTRSESREQHLLSVLMVMPPPGVQAALEAITETVAFEEVMTLSSELSQHGARPEVLADGSLVATLRHTRGVATDQAAAAARCALVVKARWPGATIALGTGRGLAAEGGTAGEVFDRAAALLRAHAGGPGAGQILLDEVTAGLLSVRFVVQRSSEGASVLSGEEVALDAARPLLGKPTPCVGRDIELAMLESALAATIEESEPHAVLVTAPPGAGKSRLMHELLRRVHGRDEEVMILIGRGDPVTSGASYGVLGQALRRLCGALGGESEGVRRSQLAERIAERIAAAERRRVVAFVGELCGVPFPEDDDPRLRSARQDPQIMSDQIARAAKDFLRAELGERAVLLVLEDLHWSDAPSLRLIEVLLRGLEGSPLMVLGLARPEIEELFPRLWGGLAQLVPLRPLGKKAGEKLVQQVLGKHVSAATMARIVAQSEGNALFLEELIRAAADGHGDEAPATVMAILQARIARLPPDARRALRAASVLGQACWRGGVAAVAGPALPAADLERGLSLLVSEEILEARAESRFAGEQEYRFRHALMRDAAYSLLADDDRALSHRRAGEYLEARGEPDARALAEHFLQGRDLERAIGHFARAAEQSYEANNIAGVFSAVERGLACGATGAARGLFLSFQIDRHLWSERYAEALAISFEALRLLPPGSKRWCWTVQYAFAAASYLQRTDLSSELMALFADALPAEEALSEYAKAAGWLVSSLAAEGKKDACLLFLDRARRIGRALSRGDVLTQAHVLAAEAVGHYAIEEAPWSLMRCNKEARDALRDAGEQRTQVLLATSYATALFELGDAPAAEAELRATLAQAERLNETLPVAFAKAHLADVLARTAPLEQLGEAERLAGEVLATNNMRLARETRAVLAEIKRRRGDLPGAEEEARALLEGVRKTPGYAWEAIATLSRILLERGRAEEARALAQEGVTDIERLGLAGRGEIEMRLNLAEALFAQGRADEARAVIADDLTRLKRRTGDIPGDAARERYVKSVPVNARLIELAASWLGTDPQQVSSQLVAVGDASLPS